MKEKLSDRQKIGFFCARLLRECDHIDFTSDYAEGVRWAVENIVEYIKDETNFTTARKKKSRQIYSSGSSLSRGGKEQYLIIPRLP